MVNSSSSLVPPSFHVPLTTFEDIVILVSVLASVLFLPSSSVPVSVLAIPTDPIVIYSHVLPTTSSMPIVTSLHSNISSSPLIYSPHSSTLGSEPQPSSVPQSVPCLLNLLAS